MTHECQYYIDMLEEANAAVHELVIARNELRNERDRLREALGEMAEVYGHEVDRDNIYLQARTALEQTGDR